MRQKLFNRKRCPYEQLRELTALSEKKGFRGEALVYVARTNKKKGDIDRVRHVSAECNEYEGHSMWVNIEGDNAYELEDTPDYWDEEFETSCFDCTLRFRNHLREESDLDEDLSFEQMIRNMEKYDKAHNLKIIHIDFN